MKKVFLILILSLSMITISNGQDLYLRIKKGEPKEYPSKGGWELNLKNNKYYKFYFYLSSTIYNGDDSFYFKCEDRNLYSQILPIFKLPNYPIKTITQLELEMESMTLTQKANLMRGFQNIYIVEVFPDNPNIFELSKVILKVPSKL
jgi:hypothetical protein